MQHSSIRNYGLFGLEIVTTVPLSANEFLGDGTHRVRYRQEAEDVISPDLPLGTVLLRDPRPDAQKLLVRRDNDFVLLQPGYCRFVLSTSDIAGTPSPDLPNGYLELLFTGNALAAWLSVHGSLCLHAAAVEHDGAAIGIIGASGAGKSTVLAHLCRLGCRFVTDDVLRVEVGPLGPVCWPGGKGIRLREDIRGLTSGTGSWSADGRWLSEAPETDMRQLPIKRLIVLPDDRSTGRCHVQTLSARAGLAALLSNTRLVGWTDSAIIEQQFELSASIVSEVELCAADVPDLRRAQAAELEALIE